MATKKQKRAAAEAKRAKFMADLKESNLAHLKAAQRGRLDEETKKKIDTARHAESIMMEDIRRAWAQGETVRPWFGWDAKWINRLEKRVAREGYTYRMQYSKYSIMAKPRVQTETMFFSFTMSDT